jgi:hypothetical protein
MYELRFKGGLLGTFATPEEAKKCIDATAAGAGKDLPPELAAAVKAEHVAAHAITPKQPIELHINGNFVSTYANRAEAMAQLHQHMTPERISDPNLKVEIIDRTKGEKPAAELATTPEEHAAANPAPAPMVVHAPSPAAPPQLASVAPGQGAPSSPAIAFAMPPIGIPAQPHVAAAAMSMPSIPIAHMATSTQHVPVAGSAKSDVVDSAGAPPAALVGNTTPKPPPAPPSERESNILASLKEDPVLRAEVERALAAAKEGT